MTAETAFLVAASVSSIVWWVPQLVRIMRRGAAGVSVETWAASAANLTLWGVWAVSAAQLTVAAIEFVQAAGSAVVVAKAGVTRRAVGYAAALVAVVVIVVVVERLWPPAASVAAVGSVAAVRVPQLVHVLRVRSASSGGVSALAWAMSATSNAMWLGWGVTSGQATMIAGATLSIMLSSAIAVATVVARKAVDEQLLPDKN